jgi:hypothetical protein
MDNLANSLVSCFFGPDAPVIQALPDWFTRRDNKRRATANACGPNKRQQISAALSPELLERLKEFTGLPDVADRFQCRVENTGQIALAPIGYQPCLIREGETHHSNRTIITLGQDHDQIYCFGCEERKCCSIIPSPTATLTAPPTSKLLTALLPSIFDNFTVTQSKTQSEEKQQIQVDTNDCMFCKHTTNVPHKYSITLYRESMLTVNCLTCHKVHQMTTTDTVIPLPTMKIAESDSIETELENLRILDSPDQYYPADLTASVTARVLGSLKDDNKPYTLLDRSNMGVGKTRSLISILRDVLQVHPTAKILVECSRRSLGAELFSQLQDLGFELYSELQGQDLSTKQLLICQLESTCKLIHPNGKPCTYDVVVVDEWSSHLSQFRSDTVRNPQLVLELACLRYRDAKSMLSLCADAGLPQLSVLEAIRPTTQVHNIMVSKSSAAIHVDYISMAEAKSLIINALFDLSCTNNIIVPSNSLSECLSLIENITARAKYMGEWNRHLNHAKQSGFPNPESWATERLESLVNGVQFLKGDDADQWYKDNVFKAHKIKEHVPKILWRRSNDDGKWSNITQTKCGDYRTTRLFIFTPTLVHGCSFDKGHSAGHFNIGVALFTSTSTCGRECVQALARLREMKIYAVGIAQDVPKASTPSTAVDGASRVAKFYQRKQAFRGQQRVEFIDPWQNVDSLVSTVRSIIEESTGKEREATKMSLIDEMERVRRNNQSNTATLYTGLNAKATELNEMEKRLAKINKLDRETHQMVLHGPRKLQTWEREGATFAEQLAHNNYLLSKRVQASEPLSERQLALMQQYEPQTLMLRNTFVPVDGEWKPVPATMLEDMVIKKKVIAGKTVTKKLCARILGVVLHKLGFMPGEPFNHTSGLLKGDIVPPSERLQVLGGLVNLINLTAKEFKIKSVPSGLLKTESIQALRDCWKIISKKDLDEDEPFSSGGEVYKLWASLLVKIFDQNLRPFKMSGKTEDIKRTVHLHGETVRQVRFPTKLEPSIVGPLFDSIGRGITDHATREEFYSVVGDIKAWKQTRDLFDEHLPDSFELAREHARQSAKGKGKEIKKYHDKNIVPDMDVNNTVVNVRLQVEHIKKCLDRNASYPIANFEFVNAKMR